MAAGHHMAVRPSASQPAKLGQAWHKALRAVYTAVVVANKQAISEESGDEEMLFQKEISALYVV